MSFDWDQVTAHALILPGAEMSTYYGGPAIKVNGNAFLTPGREEDSFHLMLDLDTVDMLMETDPDTFWQTPHYVGWPGLLVRYDSADPERVLAVIEQAHARATAKKPPKPRATKKKA